MLKNDKSLYIMRIYVDKPIKTFKELLNSQLFNKLSEFLSELLN